MTKMKYRDWLTNEIEVLFRVSLSEIYAPLAEHNRIGIEELSELNDAATELAMSRVIAVMTRYKIGFNQNWLIGGPDDKD